MSGAEDADLSSTRKFKAPFSAHHPIPTIQHYREEKQQRAQEAGIPKPGEEKEGLKERYQNWRSGKDSATGASQERGEDGQTIYPSPNKGVPDAEGDRGGDQHGADKQSPQQQESEDQEDAASSSSPDESEEDDNDDNDDKVGATSQHQYASDRTSLRKHVAKGSKKRKGDRAEREVTDPVTHLPIKIHDFTTKDLEAVPENEAPPRPAGDLGDEDDLKRADREQRQAHEGMEQVFPPPNFDAVRLKIAQIERTALLVGVGCVLAIMAILLLIERIYRAGEKLERKILSEDADGKVISSIILLLFGAGGGGVVIWGIRDWADKRIGDIWESEIWEAERHEGKKKARSCAPESAQWLNSLLASVWPLINPDLFTSLADTLEDVMQASLPKLVRMVSVEDIGQGSEALRILGLRWLPHGAAAMSVTSDGDLKKPDQNKASSSDRNVPDEGQVEDHDDQNDDQKGRHKGDDKEATESREKRRQDATSNQNIAEGMEAESGDFVNLEVAFSYRARAMSTKGKFAGLRNKAKKIHLYLAFYLPSNIKLPVWVEVRGIIGTMRARLQLTPDPPFFSLCTITFLGQPKVDLSCVPLVKTGLNVMDLPLISKFVQNSIDAAMAEYVAPKSLTVDLKDMLMGDDFKKDTSARGVLVVRIKRAYGFKEGDIGIGPLKRGSTDGYVTVGWAKFGKPMWSTRVITADMHPAWDETAFVLVTPQELNVNENLRVQLWDSDRATADDDLGRIEVPLKEIMKGDKTNGKMCDREDGFRALKRHEAMPGTLQWSVGYFSKLRVTKEQLEAQKIFENVHSMEDLKKKVDADSERKLREAKKDESAEIDQLKAQQMKSCQDQIIINTPPPSEYHSGILSIVIHNIATLELEAINKHEVSKHESESDEQEQGDDLPSAYCEIIINHQKAYKTRTKPKTSRPFYNAGTERFIRDWRKAQIHVAVRDARVHEDDALIGIVHLPLADTFKEKSMANQFYPLSGGIGFGRIRISMVFRAVQLQAPRELLGWEYGTLDINPTIKGNVNQELKGCRIKARTSLDRGKFYAKDGAWTTKSEKPVRLPVKKRYCSPAIFEFRAHGSLRDRSPAFAVLWLKDIPDDEEKTVTLSVWKGDLNRAENNVDEEYGEKVGELQVTLTFWCGLSGYHMPLAKRDPNLAEVMEILDAANDVDDEDGIDSAACHGGDEDTSDSDATQADQSGDEENEDVESRKARFKKSSKSDSGQSKDLQEDGKRGVIDQAREFKQHHKQLARRNRGLMQWKVARTGKWIEHKVERAGQKATNLFAHHSGDGKVETEV